MVKRSPTKLILSIFLFFVFFYLGLMEVKTSIYDKSLDMSQ